MTETVRAAAHRGRIDKRAAILDAALRLFIQDGYGLTRIETIAELAEVAKPTVYNHFGDKETLFRTVIMDGAARTSDQIVDAVQAGASSANLADELISLGRAIVECQLSEEGWALQRLMYAEARRFPDLFDNAMSRGGARVHAAIAGRLARIANAGSLDIPDLDTAAIHFQALVSGNLPALSALGTRPIAAKTLRAVIASGVDTFLRAFAPSPPSKPATRTARQRHPGSRTSQ